MRVSRCLAFAGEAFITEAEKGTTELTEILDQLCIVTEVQHCVVR
jgi:hypothetical protein